MLLLFSFAALATQCECSSSTLFPNGHPYFSPVASISPALYLSVVGHRPSIKPKKGRPKAWTFSVSQFPTFCGQYLSSSSANDQLFSKFDTNPSGFFCKKANAVFSPNPHAAPSTRTLPSPAKRVLLLPPISLPRPF